MIKKAKDPEASSGTPAKAAAEAPADSGSGSSVEAAAEGDTEGSVEAASETSRTGQSALTAAPEDQTETAEVSAAPDLLPEEEQRRILEENRGLWAFEEEEYSPDWYYAFTDLDHNGLLAFLSATTQGSGI